jgi:hypothetical protein
LDDLIDDKLSNFLSEYESVEVFTLVTKFRVAPALCGLPADKDTLLYGYAVCKRSLLPKINEIE